MNQKLCISSKIFTIDNDPIPGLADQPGGGFLLHWQVVKDVTQEIRGIGSKRGQVRLDFVHNRVSHGEDLIFQAAIMEKQY